jgi:DNA-binding transcriptional LysR family regulator
MRIDPNLLVVLALLLKTRSVTRTAVQMKTSQPSVSRALAQLRALLDDPLLVRTGRGMALTRRAEELAEPVAAWLAQTTTLLEPPAFAPETLDRRFRVASTDFGVLAVIAPALPRLAAAAPRAQIEIVPLKGDMLAELSDGDVDLLVSGLDPNPAQTHGRFLFREDFACLFRADHPLAGGRGPVPLDQFFAWPHIGVTVGESDFDRVDDRLGDAGARQVVARIPYFGAAPAAIGGSDAIVTVPASAARSFATQGGLAFRPAPAAMGSLEYRLLWHERTARDPASAWLRDLLANNDAGERHAPAASPKSELDICPA